MQSTEDNVQLVRTFLEFKAREGKSRRTIQSYTLKLASFLEHIDPAPIGSVSVDVLESWLDRERHKRSKTGRAAVATVRNESAVLRSAYRFWSARGMVPSNTAALLGNVGKSERQPRPADPAIVRVILAQDLPLDERFAYEAMHHLGLRREEVCHLRPSSFDLTNGVVRVLGKGDKERVIEYFDLVRWQRTKAYAIGHFEETIERIVELRAGRAAVDERGAVCETYCVPWGERSRSVFAPMADPQQVNKRLNRRLVVAGYPAGSVTPHQFRHAFATAMLRHGMDVVLVSALLGHSSLAVTQGYLDLGRTPVRDLLARELSGLRRAVQLMNDTIDDL